jgi:hypothetical protein
VGDGSHVSLLTSDNGHTTSHLSLTYFMREEMTSPDLDLAFSKILDGYFPVSSLCKLHLMIPGQSRQLGRPIQGSINLGVLKRLHKLW